MKNKPLFLFFLTIMISLTPHAFASNIKNFIDAKGQHVSCMVEKENIHCENEKGETLICSNSDAGYLCSSDQE